MGEKAMNFEIKFSHDRTTDVAFVDACEKPAEHIRIDVVDVTERLGLKTQVLARISEDGQVLGLIIQDYTRFKREVRVKYLAFAVERLLDLILSRVRDLTRTTENCSPRLPAHAAHA